MSTRRLINGENDPKVHTNMAVHLCKPAIAKGKSNLTPRGRKRKNKQWKEQTMERTERKAENQDSLKKLPARKEIPVTT